MTQEIYWLAIGTLLKYGEEIGFGLIEKRLVMRRPCILRLLATTIGLAIAIGLLAGKPPADSYHKGLLRAQFVEN
jgi:hypothetical protein